MDKGTPSEPAPFLLKTYNLIDDNSTKDIIDWSPAGDSFIVFKPEVLMKEILPKYFKHSNLCSFVRQLNTYGFRKFDPNRLEFKHEKFTRGNKALLSEITRRKSIKRNAANNNVVDSDSDEPNPETSPSAGRPFSEVSETQKKDKDMLFREILRLSQEQHSMRRTIESLTLELEESRQQSKIVFELNQKVELLCNILAAKGLISDELSSLAQTSLPKNNLSSEVPRNGISQPLLIPSSSNPPINTSALKFVISGHLGASGMGLDAKSSLHSSNFPLTGVENAVNHLNIWGSNGGTSWEPEHPEGFDYSEVMRMITNSATDKSL